MNCHELLVDILPIFYGVISFFSHIRSVVIVISCISWWLWLQDFQVLNLVGRGGFACVYRARSVKSGEEVAIKMIDKKLMKSNNLIERVKREVEIHSR